jgi:hypothetical protein
MICQASPVQKRETILLKRQYLPLKTKSRSEELKNTFNSSSIGSLADCQGM